MIPTYTKPKKSLNETRLRWRKLDYRYENQRTDFFDTNLFNEFVNEFNITKTGTLPLVNHEKYTDYDLPPRSDHLVPYRSSSGQIYYAYHTYGRYEDARTNDLLWAKERGITMEIRSVDKSWYYPGNSELVIFWWES